MTAAPPTFVARRSAAIAALAGWVFATRLWLILAGGSAIPFWDQWGAEAVSLYQPWLDGTFHWSQLFAPHNEHRIALTRIADLALFATTGGWNPWYQLLLNAVLHTLVAASLAELFWSALAPISRAIFIAILAVLFGSPCGWQNALWGFQSQVYFANALTVGAIGGLCGARPLTTGWWLGWLAATLALFSNAGGLLASVAALAVNVTVLGGLWRRAPDPVECGGLTPLSTMQLDASPRQTMVGILLLGAVVTLGIALRVGVPGHASLHPRTLLQFLSVFARGLAWPHVNRALLVLVMQLPLLWLVFDHRRRRAPLGSVARCALALGLFAVLHAAAVAYSRGAGLQDDRPLSRYQDPLLLGVAAQGFASVVLAHRHGLIGRIFLLSWLAALAFGLLTLTETNLSLNLPYKRAHDAASLSNIKDYLSTGDPAMLTRTFGLDQPPESPEVMHHVLDDPRVRRTLPPALFTTDPADATRPPWIVRISRWLTGVAAVVLLLVIAAQAFGRAASSKSTCGSER